jgi:cyclase
LLLSRRGAVKTTRFRAPSYVGDPLNIVRIWNMKEVDELILADIDVSKRRGAPDFDLIEQIASEAFMPIAYGGGVRTVAEARKLIYLGVEKICINSAALEDPEMIRRLSSELGAQCVVGSIDVKQTLRGTYRVASHAGRRVPDTDPLRWADRLVAMGAGELLINAVDRDGTKAGLDRKLLAMYSDRFDVPIIACGGASSVSDLAQVFRTTSVRALAAGALFIYEGPHRAVLPTYLSAADHAELARAAGIPS